MIKAIAAFTLFLLFSTLTIGQEGGREDPRPTPGPTPTPIENFRNYDWRENMIFDSDTTKLLNTRSRENIVDVLEKEKREVTIVGFNEELKILNYSYVENGRTLYGLLFNYERAGA